MTDEIETVTISIEDDDGTSDEITLPAGVIDLVSEGDQTAAETVANVSMLSFASRTHHLVHHGEAEGEEVEELETRVMELFEERFGVTFGEATGHQH